MARKKTAESKPTARKTAAQKVAPKKTEAKKAAPKKALVTKAGSKNIAPKKTAVTSSIVCYDVAESRHELIYHWVLVCAAG